MYGLNIERVFFMATVRFNFVNGNCCGLLVVRGFRPQTEYQVLIYQELRLGNITHKLYSRFHFG